MEITDIKDIKELDRIERITLARGEKLEVDRKEGYVIIITLRGLGIAKCKDKRKKDEPEPLAMMLHGDQLPMRLDFWRGKVFEIENDLSPDDFVPLECILIWISIKK